MKAGVYNLLINRGSPVQIPLSFRSTSTGEVMDLTGLTFKAQIRDRSKGPLILDLTAGPYGEYLLANGQILLSATKEATENLPLRVAYWDLIDNSGQKWITGKVDIEPNISEL